MCVCGLICLIKFDFQQLFVRCFEKHLLVNDLTSCQQYHFGHFQGPTCYHVSVKLTQDSTMIVAVTFFCYRNYSLKPLLEEYHTRSLPKLASKYVNIQKFPPHNVDPVATSHGSLVMSHLLVLSPSCCCTVMRWKLVRPVSFLGSELVNS